MSNRCVAAGSGNMPSDSVSLFRFLKDPHLCSVWTRQVERTRVDWKTCLACRLLRRNSSGESKLCFAVLRNRVLTSMPVESIFKHNYVVPETKPQNSRAAEKRESKMVNSSVRRVSQTCSPLTATERLSHT